MAFENNFIIGLGGTGGKSIAAFRCTTVVRHAEYDDMTKPGINTVAFEYLYIDSSDDTWKAADMWKVYGEDKRLNLSDHISIQDDGNSLAAAQNNPRISPWLGDSWRIKDNKGANEKKLTGAEQMRRYGRVLFALQAQTIHNTVEKKIDNLLQNNPEKEITFHIFATLGGGTGSGSIVDMVTLVNKVCVDKNKDAKVILYLYVGGSQAKQENVGKFYSNEYAALRDLNALMLGLYHPHMAAYISDNGSCSTFKGVSDTPISQIFICSDESGNARFETLDDQAKFMGEACFDVIYSHFKGLDPSIQKAFSGEDVQTANDREDSTHSLRFATIGIKRWCVPTDRLKELMQYLYQKIVLERWLTGDAGDKSPEMVFEKIDSGKYPPILHLPSMLENSPIAALLDEYLKNKVQQLAREFTKKDEASYDPDALATLNGELQRILKKIAEDSEDKRELSAFDNAVDEFVATVKEKLQGILAKKRQWLGRAWVWGLDDFDTCLGRFISYIQDENRKEIPQIDPESLGNMWVRSDEWRKLTLLSRNLPKCRGMLLMHQKEAIGLVEHAMESFTEAVHHRFYDRLLEELKNMQTALGKVRKILDAEAKKMKDKYLEIRDDLVTEEETSKKNHIVKYDFDKPNLMALIEYLDESETSAMYKDACMNQIETRCWNAVWKPNKNTEYHTTQNDAEDYAFELLKTLAGKECAWTLSEELVENITRHESKFDDLFHGNLYERIHQKWKKTEASEHKDEAVLFIKKLCTSASSSVDIPGIVVGGNTPPWSVMALGLPKTDYKDLKKEIREYIINNARDINKPVKTYDIESGNEIRLLYCRYWMPLHFVEVVRSTVRQKYIAAMLDEDLRKADQEAYLCNIDQDGTTCDEDAPEATRPNLLKEGQRNVMFRNKVQMLSRLPIGKSYRVVTFKESKIPSESQFIVVNGIATLPDGSLDMEETPAFKYFPMGMLRNPSNEVLDLVETDLRSYLAAMDEKARDDFKAAYKAEISQLEDNSPEGAHDPKVQAMMAHKKFCEEQFSSIRYSPKKK